MSNKAMQKKQAADVAVYDGYEGEETGFEGQTQADVAIPFLTVLQALSAQVSEGTVENAKAGMLHNSITDQLIAGDEGVLFTPALTEHCFVEWVPREQGGGFVAKHERDSQLIEVARKGAPAFNKLSTSYDDNGQPNGNDLIETFYVYGMVHTDDGPDAVVLTFTSTKIKVYKKFNTKMRTVLVQTSSGNRINPPINAHCFRITTTLEKHAGGSAFNFVFTPAKGADQLKESLLAPDDPYFIAAKELRTAIQGGLAKADHKTERATEGAEDGSPADGDQEAPPF